MYRICNLECVSWPSGMVDLSLMEIKIYIYSDYSIHVSNINNKAWGIQLYYGNSVQKFLQHTDILFKIRKYDIIYTLYML